MVSLYYNETKRCVSATVRTGTQNGQGEYFIIAEEANKGRNVMECSQNHSAMCCINNHPFLLSTLSLHRFPLALSSPPNFTSHRLQQSVIYTVQINVQNIGFSLHMNTPSLIKCKYQSYKCLICFDFFFGKTLPAAQTNVGNKCKWLCSFVYYFPKITQYFLQTGTMCSSFNTELTEN